jgi:crossover junction endodeoxyribonuclease RusA
VSNNYQQNPDGSWTPAEPIRPPLLVRWEIARPRWHREDAVSAPQLVITVHGEPAPQGSKRHVGRGVMVESSAKVKPWREAVKTAARDWMDSDTDIFMGTPAIGPVVIEVTFTLRKPASAPKTRTTWPQRKPDLDKLLRSTFDALSDAGVWVDDSQVVEVTARKVFPDEGIDAMSHPGAVIRLHEVCLDPELDASVARHPAGKRR